MKTKASQHWLLKAIFFCFLLPTGFSNAQVPKGIKFIGGQIGYSSVKDDAANSTSESFRIIPTFGYFFAPNWGIAGSMGYKNETSKTEKTIASNLLQSSKDISSAIIIIPSLRRFWVLDEKLSLFGQLDILLEFGKIKNLTQTTNSNSVSDTKTDSNYTSYGISIKPGVDYFLNPRWKIVATVGELSYILQRKQNVPGLKNSFNLGVNFSSVSFGLKYILPRKK